MNNDGQPSVSRSSRPNRAIRAQSIQTAGAILKRAKALTPAEQRPSRDVAFSEVAAKTKIAGLLPTEPSFNMLAFAVLGTLTICKSLKLLADATYKVTMNTITPAADSVIANGVRIRGALIVFNDCASSVLPPYLVINREIS